VTTSEITGSGMELSMLLPDEDASASLFDLADGVSDWINHFISGLGSTQNSFNSLDKVLIAEIIAIG
jgi:uncharacterized protein YgfB (UPF0149 family)